MTSVTTGNKNKERNEPNPASASKHRATLVAEEGRSANDMINDNVHTDWSTNHKEASKEASREKNYIEPI